MSHTADQHIRDGDELACGKGAYVWPSFGLGARSKQREGSALGQTMVAAPAQEWPEGRIMLDVEVRVWLSMRAEMLLKVRVNDRLQGRRAGRLSL